MNYELSLVKRVGVSVLLALMVVGPVGCKSVEKRILDRQAEIDDAEVNAVLCGNLEATGGLTVWGATERIQAKALATIRDADGGFSLIDQSYVIEPALKPGISVISQEPEGTFGECLSADKGLVSLQCNGQASAESPDVFAGTGVKLRLLAQAMVGAFGMYSEDYCLKYLEKERRGGRVMHKIEITGPLVDRTHLPEADRPDILVVWLDADCLLIERLWLSYSLGCPEAGCGHLAANVLDYQTLSEGLILPRKVEIVSTDRFQQFSENPMLQVEFLDFIVTQDD